MQSSDSRTWLCIEIISEFKTCRCLDPTPKVLISLVWGGLQDSGFSKVPQLLFQAAKFENHQGKEADKVLLYLLEGRMLLEGRGQLSSEGTVRGIWRRKGAGRVLDTRALQAEGIGVKTAGSCSRWRTKSVSLSSSGLVPVSS